MIGTDPTAAMLEHHGDMTGIGESWSRLMETLVADGFRVVGPAREVGVLADVGLDSDVDGPDPKG